MVIEFTKENTKWKRLCKQHLREIMICPCWIVEKKECEMCVDIVRSHLNND